MKFGVFYELQLPTPWEDGDETRIFRESLEHVQLADSLGIDMAWVVEHHFLDDHSLSSSPETWLAAAAARTVNIRLGHGISVLPPAVIHPSRVAERISTLDHISNGRVEFGTGESTSRMELEAFGIDPLTKRAAWQEALSQIVDMMTMTPYPGHDGEFFSMPCRNVIPKPLQKPHPPIWVAGKPDLAASHGIGCIGFNVTTVADAQRAVDSYYRMFETGCTPIGRAVNPNMAMLAHLHVHRDNDVAHERAIHLKFFGVSLAEYYIEGSVQPGRSRSWPRFQENLNRFSTIDSSSPRSAIGSPERIRKHLLALEEAGVDQVLFLHQGGRMPHEWNCESLELFCREVMPEFQERHARLEHAKLQRLAPAIDAALARRSIRAELRDDEVPEVVPYGSASFIPSSGAGEVATTSSTSSALGLP